MEPYFPVGKPGTWWAGTMSVVIIASGASIGASYDPGGSHGIEPTRVQAYDFTKVGGKRIPPNVPTFFSCVKLLISLKIHQVIP